MTCSGPICLFGLFILPNCTTLFIIKVCGFCLAFVNMSSQTFLGSDTINSITDSSVYSSESFADLPNFTPLKRFNINSLTSFLCCSREFLELNYDLDNYNIPSNPFVNIPDVVNNCSSINDFLRCIDYIPAVYTIHQFFIDYIYFLENLLYSLDFDNSALFQTFLAFQASQYTYELNQLNYIQSVYPKDFNIPIPTPPLSGYSFVSSGDTFIPNYIDPSIGS